MAMASETIPLTTDVGVTREASKSAVSEGWFRGESKKRQSVHRDESGNTYDTSMLRSLAKVSVQFQNLHFEVDDSAKKVFIVRSLLPITVTYAPLSVALLFANTARSIAARESIMLS